MRMQRRMMEWNNGWTNAPVSTGPNLIPLSAKFRFRRGWRCSDRQRIELFGDNLVLHSSFHIPTHSQAVGYLASIPSSRGSGIRCLFVAIHKAANRDTNRGSNRRRSLPRYNVSVGNTRSGQHHKKVLEWSLQFIPIATIPSSYHAASHQHKLFPG